MDMTLLGTGWEWVYSIPFCDTDSSIGWVGCIFYALAVLSSLIWGLKSPVPYGKAVDKAASGIWSWEISPKLTCRLGFLGTLIIPWVLIYTTPAIYLWSLPNAAGLFLYYTHYFNRCIIYPFKLSDKTEPTPLHLFLFYSYFSLLDPFFHGHFLLNTLAPEEGTWPLLRVSMGAVMAFSGLWINSHHDSILTALKKEGKGYQIPRGGLFEYVSSANYLGEIVEMWGYALVTRAPMQALYALSTTTALGLRARFTHNYYKDRFGSKYPKNRKAVIPFIF